MLFASYEHFQNLTYNQLVVIILAINVMGN